MPLRCPSRVFRRFSWLSGRAQREMGLYGFRYPAPCVWSPPQVAGVTKFGKPPALQMIDNSHSPRCLFENYRWEATGLFSPKTGPYKAVSSRFYWRLVRITLGGSCASIMDLCQNNISDALQTIFSQVESINDGFDNPEPRRPFVKCYRQLYHEDLLIEIDCWRLLSTVN